MASENGKSSRKASDRNGTKRNGHPQTNANSLANLKPPFKKGHAYLPLNRNKKPRGFMGHLREALSEEVTTTDGRKICREQALAELLARRAIRQLGTDPKTGEPRDWCKSIDHVLNRIAPVPRTADVEIERAMVATVNSDGVCVAFLEKVRQFSGEADVAPDDVLGYMDGDIDIRVGDV